MYRVLEAHRRDEAMRAYVGEPEAGAMFADVACLIYVFDIHARPTEVDLIHFEAALDSLRTHSPEARLYTLLHKTDLLPPEAMAALVKERRVEVEKRAIPSLTHTFATSIWDETLYKAWSAIVHALMPRVRQIEARLAAYAEEVRADEIVLFEPNTLLVLAQAVRHAGHDHHRLEKLSSIVKQFRMSCMAMKTAPSRFVMRSGAAIVILERVSEDAVVLTTGRQGHLAEGRVSLPELMEQIVRADAS